LSGSGRRRGGFHSLASTVEREAILKSRELLAGVTVDGAMRESGIASRMDPEEKEEEAKAGEKSPHGGHLSKKPSNFLSFLSFLNFL
jgi:hypothetical protein